MLGAIQIIRYANRLEFRNPGHSLVSEEPLGKPGSQARNPVVAAILHGINLAETKGSGVRVMRHLMDEVGRTPPAFESDREANQFVVTLLFNHFLSQPTPVILYGTIQLEAEEKLARSRKDREESGEARKADGVPFGAVVQRCTTGSTPPSLCAFAPLRDSLN